LQNLGHFSKHGTVEVVDFTLEDTVYIVFSVTFSLPFNFSIFGLIETFVSQKEEEATKALKENKSVILGQEIKVFKKSDAGSLSLFISFLDYCRF